VRLGTRWGVGDTVPVRLPEQVVLAVRTVEDELNSAGIDTHDLRWTLTWLEDLPVVDLDEGTQIRCNRDDDSITIERGYADFS